MLALPEAAPTGPHAPRSDRPPAPDRGHGQADRRPCLRAVRTDGGGDRDCARKLMRVKERILHGFYSIHYD
jgi:hypothetical protein